MGGSHTIKANYNDDTNYGPAFGTLTGGQQVNKEDTTTQITIAPVNPIYGQQITFTASVQGTPYYPGTPTGTVTFTYTYMNNPPVILCNQVSLHSSGSRIMCSPQQNGSTATCQTDVNNPLIGGGYQIQATYDPGSDPDFNGSTEQIPFSIARENTTVTFSSGGSGPIRLRPLVVGDFHGLGERNSLLRRHSDRNSCLPGCYRWGHHLYRNADAGEQRKRCQL